MTVEHINEHDNGQNSHPFFLNQLHRAIGYTELRNAKRALSQSFKEGHDFVTVLNNEHGYNENTGRSEDGKFISEMIYLTEKCFEWLLIPIRNIQLRCLAPQLNNWFLILHCRVYPAWFRYRKVKPGS